MERASEGALEEAIKLWRDLEGYCELRRVENRRSHTQQGLAMKEQRTCFLLSAGKEDGIVEDSEL